MQLLEQQASPPPAVFRLRTEVRRPALGGECSCMIVRGAGGCFQGYLRPPSGAPAGSVVAFSPAVPLPPPLPLFCFCRFG